MLWEFPPVFEYLLARMELAEAVHPTYLLFGKKAGAHFEFVVAPHYDDRWIGDIFSEAADPARPDMLDLHPAKVTVLIGLVVFDTIAGNAYPRLRALPVQAADTAALDRDANDNWDNDPRKK